MVRRKVNLKKENSLTKIEPDFDAFIKELQEINQDLSYKKIFAKTELYIKILWAFTIILWIEAIIFWVVLLVDKLPK